MNIKKKRLKSPPRVGTLFIVGQKNVNSTKFISDHHGVSVDV